MGCPLVSPGLFPSLPPTPPMMSLGAALGGGDMPPLALGPPAHSRAGAPHFNLQKITLTGLTSSYAPEASDKMDAAIALASIV